MTDTFGGEANYCWVRRAKLTLRDGDILNRQLFKLIRREFELEGIKFHRHYQHGNAGSIDLRGHCVRIFYSLENEGE